jgi:hypothetical protein
MHRSKKAIDVDKGFQFAHDSGQRRPIVVHFRFLHATLTIRIVKKGEYLIERLFRVINDIGKRASVAVVEELLFGNERCRHGRQVPSADSTLARANIVGPIGDLGNFSFLARSRFSANGGDESPKPRWDGNVTPHHQAYELRTALFPLSPGNYAIRSAKSRYSQGSRFDDVRAVLLLEPAPSFASPAWQAAIFGHFRSDPELTLVECLVME